MRALHVKEYTDYIRVLQKSIFKILPLYEEKNPFLQEYIEDLYLEVEHVKNVIDIMPNGAWYPTTLASLERLLKEEITQENNKRKIRKLVLHITALIQKQIESIKE